VPDGLLTSGVPGNFGNREVHFRKVFAFLGDHGVLSLLDAFFRTIIGRAHIGFGFAYIIG